MAKQPKAVPQMAPAQTQMAPAETLNGSNTLPAMIEITATESVQLGDIVMAAHKASGLSIEDWNALAEGERDSLLNKAIDDMKARAAISALPEDLRSDLAEAAIGSAEGVRAFLQERVDEARMIVSERIYIISAPAGPRRRAGLGFSPVPVELRFGDLGTNPEATLEALCADPMLKIDGRYEERPADID